MPTIFTKDIIESCLEALKKSILSRSGIKVVSPGDCKKISEYIERTTGKLVSETTLKRFFGFAARQFNFSRFTLNTFCEFIGYAGWDDFCHQIEFGPVGQPAPYSIWEQFREEAMKFSIHSLSVMKKLCGIPFEHTRSRNSIETDFDFFLKSDYQLFCITGLPGIGKTVEIIHLAEKFFIGENALYPGSILWLIKDGISWEFILYNTALDNIDSSRYVFGEKTYLIETFREDPGEVKGKLILMIDGFDDHMTDNSQLDIAFQKIINLLCYVEKLNWIKVVLSMRISSWILFQQKINQFEYMRQTWFSGILYVNETKANLCPLTKKQCDCIIKSIHSRLHIDLLDDMNVLHPLIIYPYFLQLYYRRLLKENGMNVRGYLLFCELISSFVTQKIHQGRYNTEKDLLLRWIVKMKDNGTSDFQVEKRSLIELGDSFLPAYKELINDGVLQEMHYDNKYNYQIFIHFVHEPVYLYFIAEELIEKADELSGTALFSHIKESYKDNETTKMLLMWVFLHFITKDGSTAMNLIFHPLLSLDEKEFLMLFTCDLLENSPEILGEKERELLIEKNILFLSMHLLELNQLGKKHERAISILIDYTDDLLARINLLLLLGILYFLRLDKASLSSVIMSLRQINDEIFKDKYPIHPLRAVEYLYNYYSSEGTDNSVLAEVKDFFNNPPALHRKETDACAVLSLQYGIYIELLHLSSAQTITLTENLRRNSPGFFNAESNYCLARYLLIKEAFSYLKLHKINLANRLIRDLLNRDSLLSGQNSSSPFSLLWNILIGVQLMAEKNYKQAIIHFTKVYEDSSSYGYNIIYIYAAIHIVRVYKLQSDFEKIDDLSTDVRRFISRFDFSSEKIFLRYTLVRC